MKFTIKEFTKRHIDKLNKDIIEATVEDINGLTTSKVQMWQEFPNFTLIEVGSEIEGDLVEKEKNGFKNITIYPPRDANVVRLDANINKEITVAQLSFTVETLRLRIIDLENFVEDYKNGKVLSDFSAEKVDKRVAELKKELEVEEIDPESIPF